MPSKQFELATVEVEKVNGVLSNDELLELYAYYKVATGADFASATKPGAFDFKGKYKYQAWEKQKDLTPAEGEKKYIELVESLKKKHGYDPKRTKKADNSDISKVTLDKFDKLSKELGRNQ